MITSKAPLQLIESSLRWMANLKANQKYMIRKKNGSDTFKNPLTLILILILFQYQISQIK